MIFAICILNIVVMIFFWVKYAEIALERIYLTIFSTCYVFTYFGGLLLAKALFLMLGIEKIDASDDVAWQLVVLSEICFACFALSYFGARPVRRLIKGRNELDWGKGTKGATVVLLLSFFVAMSIYVVGSGGPVLFKEGGYENRYDANVGMGAYSLFFSMGLLGCTMVSLKAKTKSEKRNAFILTVIYCALTFVVLGGYRQLGFAALFSYGVVSLLRKDISFGKFIFSSCILIIVTLAVAMLRYTGTSADDVGGIYGRLFIFLYDGFAPVDAFYNIVSYCKNHQISENVIFNQFETMIPRAIWPEKPLIVLNSGNFYTQNVLGRQDAITYSPTILGELYLVGGNVACIVGASIAGVILRIFDEIIIKSRWKFLVAFFFAFAFVFVFNLYREGLSVLMAKIMLFGSAAIIIVFISKIVPVRNGSAGGI